MEEINILFWYWFILGGLLVLFEIFAPGTFFLWMGISAFVVGLVLFLFPGLAWEYQIVLFAMISISSIVGWRTWFRKHPVKSDNPLLNKRAQHTHQRERIVPVDDADRLGDKLRKTIAALYVREFVQEYLTALFASPLVASGGKQDHSAPPSPGHRRYRVITPEDVTKW